MPLTNAIADPVEVGTPEQGRGPGMVLATAAWLGLMTGLVELVVLFAWHQIDESTVLGALQMNRHFAWMVPVAHLAIFVLVGLPMALVVRLVRRGSFRATAWALTALAIVSILLMVPQLHAAATAALAVGLARPISGWLARRSRGLARVVRWSLPTMAGMVAILGALTFYHVNLEERRTLAALPAARPGAPNVLLVVLDTLAAGHMSLHGYSRQTTPCIDRLAKRGVVFDEARAAAPWTLPSHASLFTGRWPHELGKVSGGKPLDATHTTLAEFLAGRGYATAGFVGNTYFCNSWYGLARGFAHYEDYYENSILISPNEALRCTALGRWLIRLSGTAYNARPETANYPKDVDRINRDFLRWVDGEPDRPFFAFLNYIEAHDPYIPPPGFEQRFGIRAESIEDIEMIRTWHRTGNWYATERDKALIVDAYDDCIAALDEGLGRLFDDLERRGILENTLVIVTSDHGEQFAEHGKYGHGRSLYRQEVHVPLIVFGPAGVPAGQTVDAPVSLRDVAATVVDRLGFGAESPFPGRTLARFWETGGPVATGADPGGEPILAQVNSAANPSRTSHPRIASVVAEGAVYIRDHQGAEELYDLDDDPAEARNLAGRPESAALQSRARAVLDALVGPVTRSP
jgi:arylsulfatase A-like enzyme